MTIKTCRISLLRERKILEGHGSKDPSVKPVWLGGLKDFFLQPDQVRSTTRFFPFSQQHFYPCHKEVVSKPNAVVALPMMSVKHRLY